MINPEEDGITHINIYSKGKTNLGRWLSNFSYCPLLTEDGYFASVEAYWYWLLCDCPEKDSLRSTSGFQAKQLGRELAGKDWNKSEEFKEKIKKVLLVKINMEFDMFDGNELPFDHYYVYNGKVIKQKEGQWIVDFFNSIRESISNSQQDEDQHEPMW